jgi:signal peptide peptidase SppA
MREISVDLTGLSVPHLEQYFGPWAMQDEIFTGLVDRVSRMDIRAHVQEQQAAAGQRDGRDSYEVLDGGVAVIEIIGSMMKYGSSFSRGAATSRIRRAVRSAAADEAVKAIVMLIDSPGGMVAGNKDLADDVARAAAKKPVHAYIEDMGASAAYWIASQCTRIHANATAQVGSIGTYGVIYDYSGMAAREGVKAIVIRAGEFKGAGTPGTEITEAQRAEFQRTVDALNAHFLDAVSRGRKMPMERVKELADGRAHVGEEARTLGLIDEVCTFDDMLAQIKVSPGPSAAGKSNNGRKKPMDDKEKTAAEDTPKQPMAASYEEIVAACKGADAAFICKQLAGKATVEQARNAWTDELSSRLAATQAENEQLKARKPGVEPLTTEKAKGAGADASGDAVAKWNDAVEAKVKLGKTRAQAVAAVARENPELREAYVAAYNADAKRRAA